MRDPGITVGQIVRSIRVEFPHIDGGRISEAVRRLRKLGHITREKKVSPETGFMTSYYTPGDWVPWRRAKRSASNCQS